MTSIEAQIFTIIVAKNVNIKLNIKKERKKERKKCVYLYFLNTELIIFI